MTDPRIVEMLRPLVGKAWADGTDFEKDFEKQFMLHLDDFSSSYTIHDAMDEAMVFVKRDYKDHVYRVYLDD